MSELTIYAVDAPAVAITVETDFDAIASALRDNGIRFERRPTVPIRPDANANDVLDAYRPEIDRLKAAEGYVTIDAIRVRRGAENAAAMRGKFLDEHTHIEDEIRLFVEGQAAFYLRNATQIARVICGQGDLISVPAGTRHWFDMGPDPEFTAIRFFLDPDGWVGHFTGDKIADLVPRFDD